MLPFSRRSDARSIDRDISEAVRFAAREWTEFRRTSDIPHNLGLKIQFSHFAKLFRPKLERRYRSLKRAPPELIVLIMAEGISASGSASRSSIEQQLGITLPGVPVAE